MMVWSEFYDDLLPDVPGCLPAVADKALHRAAEAFFRKTRIWRETLEPIQTYGDQAVYDFPVCCGAAFVKLEAAKLDSKDLNVLTAEKLQAGAFGVGVLNADEVQLNPMPKEYQELVLHVSLTISKSAGGIPDVMYEDYADAIVAGALAYLMRSPQKPYTDFNLSQLHQSRFDAAIDDTKSKAFRARGRSKPRVKAFYF